MFHVLNYTEYSSIDAALRQKDDKLGREYYRTIDALTTNWLGKLGMNEIGALLFLLNRTLKFGNIAAKIPFPAFLEGVNSQRQQRHICAGLGLSKNTVRATLKSLIEADLVHVYFPQKIKGMWDDATRCYEVNFKKLQNIRYSIGGLMERLRTPKAKKVVAESATEEVGNRLKVGKKQANSGIPKFDHLSSYCNHTKVCNGIAKAILTDDLAIAGASSESDVESSVEASVEQPVRSRVRITRVRSRPAALQSIANEEQPTAPATDSTERISAQIAQIIENSNLRRQQRAAKAKAAPATALRQEQVQALCDEAMKQYHPTLPRIRVTGKAFGAMRGHLKRAAPANFPEFVNWVIRSWEQIAYNYQQFILITLRKEKKAPAEPLPSAPDFSTLAYRLPLFLRRYASFLAERGTNAAAPEQNRKEQALREENARLARALADANREKAVLAKTARTARREAQARQTEPLLSIVRAKPTAGIPAKVAQEYHGDDSLDDSPIPTWEEANSKQRSAR